MNLFESHNHQELSLKSPLADRMRPQTLDDLVGQGHMITKGSLLEQAIVNDRVFSMILWGPPGCGKTTLAGIIANATISRFVRISAVLSGVKDIRQIIDKAKEHRSLFKKRTLLFVDEIHRFNKAQQDAFLHHVENGLITLIGATTENPSFEVIPALVSRCRVFTLKQLAKKDIAVILKRALTDTQIGLGMDKDRLTDDAIACLAQISEGDARAALTHLETAVLHFEDKPSITACDIESAIEKKMLLYDKAGEEHFNLISAFIKSMRGSDPDAAIYWLERMLMAGDDPCYLLRRIIRFATEDIGLADPGALTMALNASESFRILGHPEGDDALFQAAIYLATAPKSNAVYKAHKKVKQRIEETGYKAVPFHIRNSPTKLMKDMGYGKGYKYAHDYKGGVVEQTFLPDELDGQAFYEPTERGYEKLVKQRLDAWEKLKNKKSS
ncbi:MAG: replication-associated recombination protein A [Desulfobacula sp.]|nr:replication-associated recombination protein A [Desulfobacula sp.]